MTNDGFAAKRSKIHTNKPNDTAELEANIKKHGAGTIFIESIYSVTGDVAPLEEIIRIKKQYGCVLVVDESHSFGLYGERGYIHWKNMQDDVDFITASLSKAYCTRAGIIFGPAATFVKENSFHYIFSSALANNDIVRIRAMWEIIKSADDRRKHLHEVSQHMRREISKVVDVVKTSLHVSTAIIAIRTKSEEEMAHIHRFLSFKGIASAPFFYPATPTKYPIVRLTVNCGINMEDIPNVVTALADLSAVRARI